MEIKIEKLQVQDLDEFWQVFNQVLQNDFPGYSKAVVDYFLNKIYTKDNFNHWLKTGWKIILVAKIKISPKSFLSEKERARVLGFAVIDKPYGGVCFCRWLGVLKEFRNKGVGKNLIEKWINFAKNYDCHKVEITSQSDAKKFYEKAGLNLEGKRVLSYFGINQYIFGKVIGKPKDEVMIRE